MNQIALVLERSFRQINAPKNKQLQSAIHYLFCSTPSSGKGKQGSLIRKGSSTRLEKVNKELKQLAKENFEDVGSPELIQQRIKSMNPLNVYKKMDTSFDGFFLKREYNKKNFNFLLSILAEKGDLQNAESVFQLMKEMNIEPDSYSYNSLIKVCGKQRNMEKAEEYFEQSLQKFGANLFNYNSLLLGYARNQNALECEKITREMEEKGLKLDAPIYTTLINAHYKSRNLRRCWEIFEKLEKEKQNLIDIPMTSLMIEIASHTRDAEKGKLLWGKLDKMPEFYPNTIHFNNIIKCLGSRGDYADEAIDMWLRMKELGVQPDEDTFVHLFKACSSAGDIKTAFDALQIMKLNKIPMNKYILNSAIKVYGGVVKSDYMTNDLIDIYIKDAWKLFERAVKENMVDVHIINSLLDVHVKALREDDVDGLILPLYEKYNIKKNTETYENLLELYHQKKDLPQIYKLHGWLKSEGLDETWKVLNYVFDAAYRAEDVDVMCKILDQLLEMKKEPKIVYLKKLGENKNTPDVLFVRLKKFKNQFGYVKDKDFQPIKPLNKRLQGTV
ncbi:PPR domain protein (macronuclear) [Tetrahymena thermophila SB210]|uniref:PPR domain protein n=1 Tax=Tetrahymena thermophila (strain SB210) TaxID=312017 RepID=I7M6X0_TETTS|nr:PPR domain protein [Tetrahymena thermophila SB210]EAR87412.2 PPR domain protein [Tetrahymena thermophila SB210]|eukprot:XP_001007657.2 PPR domain protein [Tetrahymena thermophila SB210]